MKKFLLSLAVVLLGLGAANAGEASFDFVTKDYGLTRYTSGSTYIDNGTKVSADGVDVVLNKKEGTNGWRLWSDGLRAYKNSDAGLTITAGGKKITSVVMTMKAKLTSAYTLNEGESVAFAGSELSVTCDATELNFVFTVANNSPLYTIKVTYEDGGDTPALKPAGLSYSVNSFSVAVGGKFEAPELTNPNNLTVAYSSSDTNVAEVDAATGAVTVKGAGKTVITASSEETEEFAAGSASYELSVVKSASSVAEFIALGDKESGIVNFPLTVAFVNAKNIFAVDADGDFIQVYGENSYKANDVIPAGWTGTYSYYNGNTPEIMPVDALPASTETAEFTPKAVAAADIDNGLVNSVIVIKNVEFADATPDAKVNFEGVADGETLSFRNNYSIKGVEAGVYDVTVVVTIFSGAPSLYVIGYEEAVAELPDAPSVKVGDENYGDGSTVNGQGLVIVTFPAVEEGQAFWYKVSTATRAAEEGFSKLEGNKLNLYKMDNVNGLSYYLGDEEGTPLSKIATLKVDIKTAVEGIDVESADAIYYDLNGRAVAGAPGKGVYIKVAGNKVSKVIVK